MESNPVQYLKMPAEAHVNLLVSNTGSFVKILNKVRPNILIIVIESFGSSMIGPPGKAYLQVLFDGLLKR